MLEETTVVPTEAAQVEPDATPTEATETEAPSEAPPTEKPEEMFPKKAVNAISRRDKKIGKQAAELEQLRQEVAKLRTTVKPVEVKKPQESDYGSYSEYLEALADHKVDQRITENQTKQAEEALKTKEQEWEQEREEAIEANAEEAKKAFPDFQDVMRENLDDLQAIAPHVKRALLEAENGAYALYLLAKDGQLDSLNEMSPYKVAMTIARMEDKGLALSKQKTATKAPPPISSAKGMGATSKTIHDMSPEELVRDWLKT